MQARMEWFVVADAARARVLARRAGEKMRVVGRFEHLASRQSTSELGDGKAGRETGGSSYGGAAFQPRSDAHRKEHLRFAHELAHFLEHEAGQGSYDSVTLIAPNPFLGELKAALGRAAASRVATSMPLDLSMVGPAEIDKRIDVAMAG